MAIDYNAILNEIGEDVVVALTKELLAQNHRATGSLIGSLNTRLQVIPNGFEIQGLMNRYGFILDQGVRSSVVKARMYNPHVRTGRKHSDYIQALADWIKLKGLNVSPFAIAAAHAREGIPTKRRQATTRNKGKGWLSLTLREKKDSIGQSLSEGITKGLRFDLNSLIRENQKKFAA